MNGKNTVILLDFMKKQLAIKLFVKYLKTNGIYLQFRHYSSDAKYWRSCFPYLSNKCNMLYLNYTDTPTFYINYAFAWDKTKEGFSFWHYHQIQWIRYWREYVKNKP